MSDGVLCAIISVVGSGLITVITVLVTNAKSRVLMKAEQDQMREEMAEMKADIKEHNSYAKHMPVIDEKVSRLEEDVRELRKGKMNG